VRYIVQPQKWSERFNYDEGFAILDTVEGVQIGWAKLRDRANECAAEHNAQEPTTPEQPK
jgi:hypothetical protein